MSDGTSPSAPGVVMIYIDDAPTVQDTTAIAYEEVSKTIPLLGTDVNGDSLVFSVVSAPKHGTTSIAGRYLTYTPDKDFHGADSLTYRTFDGIQYSNSNATLNITVDNVNDPPVAKTDSFPVAKGETALLTGMLDNDTDVDGDTLTVVKFTNAAHGSLSRTGNIFAYTPAAGYSGVDQFTYTVDDGHGLQSTAPVVLSVGNPSLQGDWTTFGNGAAHTGYYPGTILGGTFEPSWSNDLDGGVSYQPVVAGGKVFVVSKSYFGSLYAAALDVNNGKELWRHVFASGHGMNPATYYNGKLYLQRGNHGSDTQLWSLNASDGSTAWSAAFSAQWENYFAPAVNDSGIWINGGYYGGMYGFTHTGSLIKFVSLAQYDEWTPSIVGSNVYSYVEGGFTKYDLNGTPAWTNTKNWNWSGWSMNRTTALANNQAFLIGNPDFYSVDLTTGMTRWTVPGYFNGTPATAKGVVYVITGNTVKSYDALSGGFIGTYNAGAGIYSNQPIITDDAMIVTTEGDTLVFDLASRTLLQTIHKSGDVSLSNNTLYIASRTNGIYAFSLKGAQPPAALGSISGIAFSDVNKNAIFDSGDTRLPGVTVFLDDNGNDTLDIGETKVTTDANGEYQFASLPSGTYHVRRVFTAGYGLSTPLLDLNIAAGQNVADADLGAISLANASISGIVFNDLNGDGVIAAGETGFVGITLYIDANNNSKLDTGESIAVTTTGGNYTFANLAGGTYKIREILQSGWIQTSPTKNYGQTVTLIAGQAVSGKNFGTQLYVSPAAGKISGMIFNDANGNGQKDSGEKGVGTGWKVYIDLDNDGTLDSNEKAVTTDASGNWSLTGLVAGTYKVRQVLQTGWKQTIPTKNYGLSIALTSNQSVIGALFGSKKI